MGTGDGWNVDNILCMYLVISIKEFCYDFGIVIKETLFSDVIIISSSLVVLLLFMINKNVK